MAELPGDPGASSSAHSLTHLLDRTDHLIARVGVKIPMAGRVLAHFDLSARGILLASIGLGLVIVLPPLVLLLLKRRGLMAKNYRGERIPQSYGILVLLCAGALFGLRSLLFPDAAPENTNWLLLILGFGGLGLLDDLRGSAQHKGLGGHVRALLQSHTITTGLVKAVGGLAIALWVGFKTHPGHPLHAVLTAALIALGANAVNLLDLRPGRAAGSFLAAGVLLILFQMRHAQTAGVPLLVFVVIPTFALWEKDSRAHAMMGDVGSNLLGATLGFAAADLPVPAACVLLAGLIGLHLYAERFSLTTSIENHPVLRFLDSLTGVRAPVQEGRNRMSARTVEGVRVRKAEREDAGIVLDLIEALAHYEELEPPDEDARARLIRDGWPEDGGAPRFQAWLAEVDNGSDGEAAPAGYAITLQTYSSFLARPTLYIEDLFVLPAYRRRAAGTALMQRLVEDAREQECGRIEWVVLDWNTSAQKFYQRLGGEHLANWQPYRMRLDP